MSYCHERGEEHDFDTVRGRINAARHCKSCSAISLDWDDVNPSVVMVREVTHHGQFYNVRTFEMSQECSWQEFQAAAHEGPYCYAMSDKRAMRCADQFYVEGRTEHGWTRWERVD